MQTSLKNLSSRLVAFRNITISRFVFSVKKEIESFKKEGEVFNVTPRIMSLTDKKLMHIENHPLSILKGRIVDSLGSQFNVRFYLII